MLAESALMQSLMNLITSPTDSAWIFDVTDIVVITETEIWPNYFIESAQLGATIAVVNGRMSERTLRRYLLAYAQFERIAFGSRGLLS